jgi:pseudouridine synthase
LERLISKSGLGSRTEARSWVHARRVSVNGRIIENPDHWVDPARDAILFDGRPLQAKPKLYLLLYKPTGYVTTYRDPEHRPTVYHLLDGIQDFVSPAGRLDLDTSGLLILTNDNAFANFLTSPESKVEKTYLVRTSHKLTEGQLASLAQGVTLSDGPTRPAKVSRIRDTASRTSFEITLTEGRNRQVRRMVEAIGSKVAKLVRTRIGPLTIGSLEIGKFRELTPQDLAALRYRSG